MENERIKLPVSLGLLIVKKLKEEHDIEPRTDSNGFRDLTFTKEELSLINSIEIQNPNLGGLVGIELLPNLEKLIVKSDGIMAHKQDKNIPSIGDSDANSISKCNTLKTLVIKNQQKLSYIDVSRLENLEKLEITHNGNIKEIHGIDTLQNLWQLDCYGNNRLFKVGNLDKVIINNSELADLNLDVLLYPEAIGYNIRTKEYNEQALKRIKEISDMGDVFWKESLNGDRSIEINNNQMIYLHDVACKIMDENVPANADTKDTIVGIEDYLSKNVKYDYDGRDHGHTSGDNFNGVRIQRGPKNGTNSAYNALVNNLCVCEGYTRGMQYLLKLRGINSHNVDCYAGKDNTHMSDAKSESNYTRYELPTQGYHSIICIDDYYNLYDDPCWNAGRYQKGDTSMPWLLKTKEEISEDHTLSFEERNVSNNHLRQTKNVIQDSLKRNELFRNSRVSQINKTRQQMQISKEKQEINREEK